MDLWGHRVYNSDNAILVGVSQLPGERWHAYINVQIDPATGTAIQVQLSREQLVVLLAAIDEREKLGDGMVRVPG